MKVLLIRPPAGDIYKKMKDITPEYPPLALASIAGVLEKQDHEVKILDLAVENFSMKDVTKYVENFQPESIGFTSTTPTIEQTYSIVDSLKSEFKNKKFVLGGPHASALPEEALEHFDIIVRGEGEYSMLDIANNESPEKIKGISFKHESKNIHNPERPQISDLDELPLPARHLLKMGKYHYFGARRHPITNIFTSRGCPFSCTYCNKTIFGKNYRALSVKRVIEEIDQLVNDFGIREIHVSDDTFNFDRKRTIDLFTEIKKRNYDLLFFPHNGVRVNSIDREVLKLLRDVGFYAMSYGVEAGNQTILNNIKKGISISQVRDAVKLTKEFDFEIWMFFILGLPGETKQTMRDSINLAIDLNPDFAKFSILVPYPGTEVYNYYKDSLLIKKWSDFGLWSDPTFKHENLTKEELQSMFRQAYRRFYLRPSPIFKFLKRNLKNPSNIKENFKAGLNILKI